MPKAMLIVDHGSRQPKANAMLEDMANLVRQKRPELIVHIAHMEFAEPSIAQGIATCVQDGATEIVVHPYMLSPGRHATKDIPDLANEAARAFPNVRVTISAPLGLHDKLADVVLDRAGF